MKSTIPITRQWQVHIPKRIREAIGLTEPQTVEIEAKHGKILITRQEDGVMADAGKYAKYARGKKIDLDNIRDQIDYS